MIVTVEVKESRRGVVWLGNQTQRGMSETEEPQPTPTQDLWHHYELVFNYLNGDLFDEELPTCVLNFATHGGSNGYFTAERWIKTRNNEMVQSAHEISLNPHLLETSIEECLSWLTRLMVQLWVYEQEGASTAQGYYNKTFTDKMWDIGLPATDTGTPSGKRYGFTMKHWVVPDGRFKAAMDHMPREYFPWKGDKRRPVKTKAKPLEYGCPKCGFTFKTVRRMRGICMTEDCNTYFEEIGAQQEQKPQKTKAA